MPLVHHLRTRGSMPVHAAGCGFSLQRQRYLRPTPTSRRVSACLTTLSFRREAHLLSSTSTSSNHNIVNSAIKSADVRRRSFREPPRFLATTSSTRTRSPTTTPSSTDAGGIKNDKDSSGLLSTIKRSLRTFNKSAIFQLQITPKKMDETSPMNIMNELEHVDQFHKYPRNRGHGPGSQKYQAHCGRQYTRQGDKKNHENNCVKCRVMLIQERDRIKIHRRLIDWVKNFIVSKLKADTACGVLDANHDNLNHAKERKAQETDRNTIQLLNVELSRVATSKLTPCDEQGYIYILRDLENGLLKIGFAKDPKVRIKQHNKCGRDLKTVHVSHCIKWSKRAERLIKLDLKHVCRPWFCSSCQQRHGEYFEVTEERAKAIVERWAGWINGSQPYGSDGNITPLWNHLILSGRAPKQAMRTHNHEARWTHWDWVLSLPSEDDLRDFQGNTEQHGFGHGNELIRLGEKSD